MLQQHARLFLENCRLEKLQPKVKARICQLFTVPDYECFPGVNFDHIAKNYFSIRIQCWISFFILRPSSEFNVFCFYAAGSFFEYK